MGSEMCIRDRSLSDIRNETVTRVGHLYADQYGITSKSLVDETTYRDYIDIYLDSAGGTAATDEHLNRLEALQRKSASFIPIYQLYLQVCQYLFDNSGDEKYLQRLSDFLDYAPAAVARTKEVKDVEFHFHLARGDLESAKRIADELVVLGIDRVEHNVLQAQLADSVGDYEGAVAIERNNALLRPSFYRFYSLAIAEYQIGDLAKAKEAATRAMIMAPNDVDVLNLVGGLSTLSGDLESAIKSYKQLINRSADSISLSNLGVSLMLSGQFKEAITYQQQALTINPDHSTVLLNIADSHNLLGLTEEAEKYYGRLLESTKNVKNDDTVLRERAQAYAHLGQFNRALKTLQLVGDRNSESAYAAAIVHSLSGNNNAAIVEAEKAITTGISPVWFHLAWFDQLCTYPLFSDLINTEFRQYCAPLNSYVGFFLKISPGSTEINEAPELSTT